MEVVVDDWAQFTKVVSEAALVGPPDEPAYVFRGQSCADWTLVPSLVRIVREAGLDAAEALKLEMSLLRAFATQAHLYLPERDIPRDGEALGWWTLMQHYGAPTRLLDWTASAYVALYFAVLQHRSCPGAVWLVHPTSVEHAMQVKGGAYPQGQQFFAADAPAHLVFLWHYRPTDRMVAQQTHFTVSTQILANHGDVLSESIPQDERWNKYVKLIIPPERKVLFLRHLRAMNITARTLFPGVDGLGRSVAELATVRAFSAR